MEGASPIPEDLEGDEEARVEDQRHNSVETVHGEVRVEEGLERGAQEDSSIQNEKTPLLRHK